MLKKLEVGFNTLVFAYIMLIASIVSIGAIFIYAAPSSDLSQQIGSGTLTTDIRDATRTPLANASFPMSPIGFAFTCMNAGSSSTGTLGSNTQRIYIDNPDSADTGWVLTIAATNGPTALWSDLGATKTYDFNDPTSSGCNDGADADSVAGQLTIDPSIATLNTDCTSCTNSNISLGSESSFVQGTTNSVTLLSAASASDDIGRWYLTGIGVKQTVPSEQAAGDYTINLTLTVTAM